MGLYSTNDRARVVALLADGYRLWSDSILPDLPYSERYIASDLAAQVYQGKNADEFAAACQCFYLFRRLHGLVSDYPDWATLLGDYFFSQFSKYLIPLDSVPLIDSFSRFLTHDTQSAAEHNEYFDFIRALPAVMNQ
jgi:hypothetical protein